MHERFEYLDEIGLTSGAENYHEPLGGIGFEPGVHEDQKVVKLPLGKKAT